MPKKIKKVEPKTEAKVYDRNGIFVRRYGINPHGEKFQKMAEDYAKAIGYGVVK